MERPLESRFLCFLETELGLSADAIAIALNQHRLNQHREDLSLLPITLWKHQLVSIHQVGLMLDWLANVQSPLFQRL
ncbi:MAG: DUF2949 domain-containing protein [Cyanobacteria bacterium J06597_16]